MDVSRAIFHLCIDVPRDAWKRYASEHSVSREAIAEVHVQDAGETVHLFVPGTLVPHEEDSLFSSTLRVNPREQGFLFQFNMWARSNQVDVVHAWQLQGMKYR